LFQAGDQKAKNAIFMQSYCILADSRCSSGSQLSCLIELQVESAEKTKRDVEDTAKPFGKRAEKATNNCASLRQSSNYLKKIYVFLRYI